MTPESIRPGIPSVSDSVWLQEENTRLKAENVRLKANLSDSVAREWPGRQSISDVLAPVIELLENAKRTGVFSDEVGAVLARLLAVVEGKP